MRSTSSAAAAVIYARTASRALQDAGDIDLQVSACLRAAADQDILVTQVFTDRGMSGNTLDRPGMRALLEYVWTEAVDYLICADEVRLARDPRLCIDLLARFDRLGIPVLCAASGALVQVDST